MPTMSRAVAALAGAAMLILATPLAASAHVTIDPGQADPGSYATLTVRVPNESETAGTVRVALSLPTDTPFTSVRYVPVPGWSTELVREVLPEPARIGESEITEAVTRVVWTAEPGVSITAGQLQAFPLSLGPVPDTGSILLPAEQGYDDGEVVSWSEEGHDAEHPAPVLVVTDEPAGHQHGDGHDLEVASEETDDDANGDVLARVLGIAGLVVGVVGIVLAVTTRRSAAK